MVCWGCLDGLRNGLLELGREREFVEFAVKRAGGNAQGLSCLGFVAVGLAKRLFNDDTLALFDVADRFAADLFTMTGGVVLQVHR